MTLLLSCFLFAVPAAAAKTLRSGDVDFDGKITPSDARLVLRASVYLEKFSDDAMRCADADRDNKITPSDARLILRASVGLETLKPLPEKKQTIVCPAKAIPATTLTFPGGKAQTVGTIRDNGMMITVQPGSLKKGSKLSATPVDMNTLRTFGLTKTTERVICPMKIECSGYDGSFFDDGVRITVPLMEDEYTAETDYQNFFFCYYDEKAKESRYLVPDEINVKNHTMTVTVPHFSSWYGVKATEEKAIEEYLDRYCMAQAIAADKRKKAASELEPYLKAKAEALGLTVEAAKDLVECAVNYIGGSIDMVPHTETEELADLAGDMVSAMTNFTTTMVRASVDRDMDKFNSAFSGLATAAIQRAWKELKFSERAASVFKNEYAKLLVPEALEKGISSAGDIGTVLGAVVEGDAEGALKAVGSIMEGIVPAAGLVTKATAFAANGLNTAFTYWKANQIEELYKIYKNGGQFLFGNEVLPRNRESFLTYLNTSSGFTLGKGVQRFYNMDKIEEVCKKYGWSFKDYESMPQRYRDIFEKRAEDGLMQYFETRYAQEAAAEKLKEKERECVISMLYDTLGALRNTNYEAFFGEEKATSYDLMARLETLYHIREQLTCFVDEAKLSKDKYQNWGKILNLYLYYITTEETRDAAMERFLWDLKKLGLLKSTVQLGLPAQLADYFGEWSYEYHLVVEGWVDYSAGVIHNGYIIDELYAVKVAKNNLGKTYVRRSVGDVRTTGHSDSVTLDPGVNYTIYGKTLIVHAPGVYDWLRLTLLSPTQMSYVERNSAGEVVRTFILTKE